MGKRETQRKSGTVAAIVTVLLGWVLVAFPGLPPVRWSYDLLQLVLPDHGHTDVVIIYMDEQAMMDYQQTPGQWKRALHARLLNRLSQDQPRVVVFDVMFTKTGDPAEDDELAQAIRRNGRVVLAGDRVPLPEVSIGYTIVPPLELFETNAAAWGTAKAPPDADRVVRRCDAGDDQEPGLAWAAATVASAPVTLKPEQRLERVRWLNYYRSTRPFETTSMTYTNAETREQGFFRDKAVFIGGKPDTLSRGDITDVFGTPFTKWNSGLIPGVEIIAIAYANLVHEEWLRRLGPFAELGLLLVAGFISGFGLQRVGLRNAVWLCLLMAFVLAAAAIALVFFVQIWFSWAVVSLVQLPCALMFRLFTAHPATASSTEADSSRETVPASLAAAETIRDNPLVIPDHTMIRCIGEGAYGQVWVARNAIGLYHAVKVVYRTRFGTEAPYQRALRGIQKFMPISRSHAGFVHILHVGRNETGGFFFYIMEAGDDQKTGQQIDPSTYAPKTLASELKQREVIPPRECLQFMLAVTEAVDRLHQHQLIHRDIKPSNIIFVDRHPKLADIDLVTDLVPQSEVSRIGTEGYMAPEGPGTAAADVFSLGRILYVALTGKAPYQSPELTARAHSQPDSSLFLELNQISCKACEFDLQRRYASAALMHSQLFEVYQRLAK